MKISDMNWSMVEDYLKKDDLAVLPLGCTEQHAFLSLSTDSILAENMAVESAEPLGVPVFPVLPYGITPSFMAYPGTVCLGIETYLAVLGDVFDSLKTHGFRRILIVNGHGGNQPAANFALQWMGRNPEVAIKFHNWWNAPKTLAKVHEIDPLASHASWMENFPWTRLAGVVQPSQQKPLVDFATMRINAPEGVKALIGDGNFGGYYEKPDEDMLAIWQVGVEETRGLLQGPWR
ncbi:creatininase family protein [Martelella alba]|uniref:Creatininase family protein n=1 Tax=Martelella alba TaxID=2590451 RepID=A0A506UJ05_9HYPH|nr:creatininase family protein [Martelella alba]TPW33278.1 creatininase family protein [Martelella alba]